MNTKLVQQIEKTKKIYLFKLIEQVSDLSKSWKDYEVTYDNDRLERVYRIAHTLAGSAGTLGFQKIGNVARVLVNLVMHFKDKKDSVVYESIDEKIFQLRESLNDTLQQYEKMEPFDTTFSVSRTKFLSGLKVMIVDDDLDGRLSCVELVGDLGATVFSAGNGREAINLFKQVNPDMVVMDVIMPDIFGFEAADCIKQLCGDTFVPIIFLSSLSESSVISHCIQQGGDDFLIKPVTPDVLTAKLFSMVRILQKFQSQGDSRERDYDAGGIKNKVDAIYAQYKNEIPNVVSWHRSADKTNGDLNLFYQKGDKLYGMLGKFDCHGVDASLGSMVASNVFYAMTEKGFGLQDIVSEMQEKFVRSFTMNQYCSAIFVCLNFASGELQLVNCGFPAAKIIRPTGQVFNSFDSKNPPLGKQWSEPNSLHIDTCYLDENESVLMYTAGLVELQRKDQSTYTDEQLVADLRMLSAVDNPENDLKEKLDQEFELNNESDNISVVQVQMHH